MSKASHDREVLKKRFTTNMRRIGDIAKLLSSGSEGLKQTGPFRSEGVRADILRAVVVFLHATLEDFVRSQLPKPNKRFTFYSALDIKNALNKLTVDPSLLKALFPPLVQLAKRRNQIVHHADLHDGESESANPWKLVDDWQLVQWNLAVVAFYYRLLRATGPISMIEDRASQNVEKALVQNVELIHAFIALPGQQLVELAQEGLPKLIAILTNMQETLKLDVEMFFGPDGEPIEGAV